MTVFGVLPRGKGRGCSVQLSSFQFIQFHQIHYKSKRITRYRTCHYNIYLYIYIYIHIQMIMREVVNLQSNNFNLI
jgi:hypothetical protein